MPQQYSRSYLSSDAGAGSPVICVALETVPLRNTCCDMLPEFCPAQPGCLRFKHENLSNTASLRRQLDFPIPCPVCKAACSMPRHRRSITSDWQNKPLSPTYVGHGPRSSPFAQPQTCCNLDADVQLLLDGDEYEGYLNKSLKAATHRCIASLMVTATEAQNLLVHQTGKMQKRDHKPYIQSTDEIGQ